jgi:small-conductance mechanosensitive channel
MHHFLSRVLADPTAIKFIIAAALIAVFVVVMGFLRRGVTRFIHDTNSRYRIRKLINFAGYGLAAVVLLVMFSNKLGGLAVALGVAGAIIAFALQEVIGSVAGWLVILLGHLYKHGDRVQIGDFKGDVVDIGVLRTTLLEIGGWIDADAYSGRTVKVSNFYVLRESVANYSGEFSFLWNELKVPVRYGSDYRLAREIISRAAAEIVGESAAQASVAWQKMTEKYVVERAVTEPSVTVVAGDNWVEFTLRYVVDYRNRRASRDRIYTRILEEFDATHGTVNFASGPPARSGEAGS